MSDDTHERLDELWRRWARRPPATPADAAARRLLMRLEEKRRRKVVLTRRWGVLAAVGAAVLAVVLAVRGPDKAPPGTGVERPPLTDGVVLIWLDPETPLYLTLTSVKGDLP